MTTQEKTGKELKDEGMALVLDNADVSWKAMYALHVPEFLATHYEFIGEDVRRWMEEEKGLWQPHHASAWSSMIGSHVGLPHRAIQTGLWLHVKNPQAHRRTSAQWRSLLCAPEGEVETLNTKLHGLVCKKRMNQIDLDTMVHLAAQYALAYGVIGSPKE